MEKINQDPFTNNITTMYRRYFDER